MNEEMLEDQPQREKVWTSNPIAFVFEPMTRWRVDRPIIAEDSGGAAVLEADDTEESRQTICFQKHSADGSDSHPVELIN